ncbi:hypothetical protein FHU30_007010 [Actinomadura rupiterrae]|nr:hypothetical protein [Actinomadura rupiterrae]
MIVGMTALKQHPDPMTYKRGDRVTARRSLGMGSVPKGAAGTVISTSFLGSYTVNFGGRTLHNISRDDIDSQAASCAVTALMLTLSATLALGAVWGRLRRSQARF